MKETKTEKVEIFSEDFPTKKESLRIEGQEILNYARKIDAKDASEQAKKKGEAFAKEIQAGFVADFEKSGVDKMAHVSTFAVIDGTVYVTYYANTQDKEEDPKRQTARLAYCPVDSPSEKTVLDIQSVGDTCYGKEVDLVYDTILARKDADTLYVLWTARVGGTYYRLYRPFTLSTKTLGAVGVNRLKVGEIENDFSASGIVSAFAENGLGIKKMYSDIGIMQKFTSRVENGETYYYTGAYSGDFNLIIKSKDFIVWEYVSQPEFPNLSKWENAIYVIGDKCYYFVRQQDETPYGFLTAYDLEKKVWETPVLIEDCQSRSDFIVYQGQLYLFHAPIDREHIGIVKIDVENLANSEVIVQANMNGSCFYPFVQYFADGELAMSYTVSREHIRLAKFTLSKYI